MGRQGRTAYALISEMDGDYRSQGGPEIHRALCADRKLHQTATMRGSDRSGVYRHRQACGHHRPPKRLGHKDALRLDGATARGFAAPATTSRRGAGPASIGSVPCAGPQKFHLHLAWLIRSCANPRRAVRLSGGAQQDRVIGTQPVARRIAEKLGGALRSAEPVRRIEGGRRRRCASDQIASQRAMSSSRHRPTWQARSNTSRRCRPTASGHAALGAGAGHQGVDGLQRAVLAQGWLSGKSFDYTALMSETAAAVRRQSIRLGVLTASFAPTARVSLLGADRHRRRCPGEGAQRFG